MSLQGKHIRLSPIDLPDSKQLRLKRFYPDAVYKALARIRRALFDCVTQALSMGGHS